MLGLGDQDAAKCTLVGDLELVETLDVEGERPARAVDLERVVVDPPAREPGGLGVPTTPFSNSTVAANVSSTPCPSMNVLTTAVTATGSPTR